MAILERLPLKHGCKRAVPDRQSGVGAATTMLVFAHGVCARQSGAGYAPGTESELLKERSESATAENWRMRLRYALNLAGATGPTGTTSTRIRARSTSVCAVRAQWVGAEADAAEDMG